MYPTHSKLVYALLAMTMNTRGDRPNNKMFGWMRRRVAKEISKAKKGVPRPPHVRELLRIAATGRKHTTEHVEARMVSVRGVAKTPEHNAKVGRKGRRSPMTGRQHSPETREKQRLAALARKHTPETVAKLTEFAAKQTPEQRSARAHKAWETKRAKAAQLRGETIDGERRKDGKGGGKN